MDSRKGAAAHTQIRPHLHSPSLSCPRSAGWARQQPFPGHRANSEHLTEGGMLRWGLRGGCTSGTEAPPEKLMCRSWYNILAVIFWQAPVWPDLLISASHSTLITTLWSRFIPILWMKGLKLREVNNMSKFKQPGVGKPDSKAMLWTMMLEPRKLLDAPQAAQVSFPGGASGKEPACQCRRHKRIGFNPWVGKIPWGRKWQPTQYSCLENSMDRGAWWATVHGVTQRRTWLSMHASCMKRREQEQYWEELDSCAHWPGLHGSYCPAYEGSIQASAVSTFCFWHPGLSQNFPFPSLSALSVGILVPRREFLRETVLSENGSRKVETTPFTKSLRAQKSKRGAACGRGLRHPPSRCALRHSLLCSLPREAHLQEWHL